MSRRVLLVCPGRGSYGRAQLGSLARAARASDRAAAILAELDAFRARLGRPTLTELDGASAHRPELHVAGEHASLLTFAATALDLAALDPDLDIVGAIGNSLGFYTALYVSGALALADAARLVETLASYQAETIHGGQILYPITDDDWRSSPAHAAAITAALDHPALHISIHLGGSVVLGGDADALAHATRVLPPVERGGLRYPMPLPLHAAFHTPHMAPTRARARADLADLAIASPARTLVDGHAVVHRPWADSDALWDYTLGAQLVEPFDFTRALATAVAELGPDAIVLLGPGDNLGSAVAQTLIAHRWRGLASRTDFLAAQASDAPFVLSMQRPAQRALVAR